MLEAGARADGEAIADLPLQFLVELFEGVDAHPLARRVLAGQETEVHVFPELVDLPAIRLATEVIVRKLAEAQRRGEVRTDIDPETIGAGIEGIILSILVTTVQLGDLSTERRQDGVVAAFAAMLEPRPDRAVVGGASRRPASPSGSHRSQRLRPGGLRRRLRSAQAPGRGRPGAGRRPGTGRMASAGVVTPLST